jgi:hypothetical protein
MANMKIEFVLVCFYFLTLVLADSAFNTTILTQPLEHVDNTITFDDYNLTRTSWFVEPEGFFMNITVDGRQQEIMLRGLMCTITRSAFAMMEAKWDGSKAWPGIGNESFPGYYIASIFSIEGDNCTLYFKEPIAQFFARVSTDYVSTEDASRTKSLIQILDINGDEISSTNIPMMSGEVNNYTTIGFSSKTPIYGVLLTNSYNVMDDIQWAFYYCKEGYFRDLDGECKDLNECEANPCSTSAQCVNSNGSFTCNCNDGFVGDGVGESGCEDVDECLASTTTCGSNAYCNNTVGGFECTCNKGFAGDAYQLDGCKEYVEPISPPATSTGPPRPDRSTLNSEGAATTLCVISAAIVLVLHIFVF